MVFSSIYKKFVPVMGRPPADIKDSVVFVADSDKLLVKSDVFLAPADKSSVNPEQPEKAEERGAMFPGLEDLGPDLSDHRELEYLGTADGRHCFCLPFDQSMNIPEGLVFRSLRALYSVLDENTGLVASRAVHLAGWNKRNKYCGVCGGITQRDEHELARRCPSCGNQIYPKISPAIIIAVVKENKLLLAHNKNFREHWYSTLAGFIEPGESIEACAEREVLEEVGIRIKNIRYFASQPWPFPDSLMIGLVAEYESGEVKPDGVEIDDAGFFSADGLPDTPARFSVAGRLIEWFVENHK